MAKKSSALPLIYLIGMALVVVGFFVPMFRLNLGAFGSSSVAGYKFIDFDSFGFVDVGALLIILGAIAGIVFCFVPMKNADLIRLICLIVSIVGGIVLVIGFNQDRLYQAIAKGFLKHAFVGFYMVLIGWVVGLVGYFMKK